MTKDEIFAIRWCYSKAMDYVEKNSPIDYYAYPHSTYRDDLIVNGVNITEIVRKLTNDE